MTPSDQLDSGSSSRGIVAASKRTVANRIVSNPHRARSQNRIGLVAPQPRPFKQAVPRMFRLGIRPFSLFGDAGGSNPGAHCLLHFRVAGTRCLPQREDRMKFVTAMMCASTLLYSSAARADSFSLNGAFSTDGVFTRLRSLACAGSGTNTVTLGTGANTATLTFNGVDTTVAIGNKATLVSLGSFLMLGGSGFTFPTRPNPNTPILKFDFSIHHTSPVDDTNTKTLWFGPGGKPNLPLLMGTDHTSFPLSLTSPGHNYPAFVYSFSPFPIKISGGGMTDLTARVGVVLEPAMFVLVGWRLAAAIAVRRRRRGLVETGTSIQRRRRLGRDRW